MRNACKVLFFLILGIIIVRTDSALSFEFFTINDFWPEKRGYFIWFTRRLYYYSRKGRYHFGFSYII